MKQYLTQFIEKTWWLQGFVVAFGLVSIAEQLGFAKKTTFELTHYLIMRWNEYVAVPFDWIASFFSFVPVMIEWSQFERNVIVVIAGIIGPGMVASINQLLDGWARVDLSVSMGLPPILAFIAAVVGAFWNFEISVWWVLVPLLLFVFVSVGTIIEENRKYAYTLATVFGAFAFLELGYRIPAVEERANAWIKDQREVSVAKTPPSRNRAEQPNNSNEK